MMNSIKQTSIKAILLILLPASAYLPAVNGPFVFDDYHYNSANPVFSNDGALLQFWFGQNIPNYWPLTYTLFYVESLLWPDSPLAYHCVAIALHIATSMMFWRLLLLLKMPFAWTAAVIFALHPVNVEAVAWISQTKTTLSAFFAVSSLLLLERWRLSGRSSIYYCSLLLFVLSLLAKSATCVLPIVALALWRRFHSRLSNEMLFRALKPLLPFFVASAICGIVELAFHNNLLAQDQITRPAQVRVVRVLLNFVFYLSKAVLPLDLSLIYPDWSVVTVAYTMVIAVGVLLILPLLYMSSTRRQFCGALALYALLLAPVLGCFEISYMQHSPVADHWQYLGLMALLPGLVFAMTRVQLPNYLRGQGARELAVAACLMAAWGGAYHRAIQFADPARLWEAAVASSPNCTLARHNLAWILLRKGQDDLAIGHMVAAARLGEREESLILFGGLLESRDDHMAAQGYYREMSSIQPDEPQFLLGLAKSQIRLSLCAEAEDTYRTIVNKWPDNQGAIRGLAACSLQRGNLEEAVAWYRKLEQYSVDDMPFLRDIAMRLSTIGKCEAADDVYRFALSIDPRDSDIRYLRANLLLQMGSLKEAEAEYRFVISNSATMAQAWANLAELLIISGRLHEAEREIRSALLVLPSNVLLAGKLEQIHAHGERVRKSGGIHQTSDVQGAKRLR